jgi:hypothetical protein
MMRCCAILASVALAAAGTAVALSASRQNASPKAEVRTVTFASSDVAQLVGIGRSGLDIDVPEGMKLMCVQRVWRDGAFLPAHSNDTEDLCDRAQTVRITCGVLDPDALSPTPTPNVKLWSEVAGAAQPFWLKTQYKGSRTTGAGAASPLVVGAKMAATLGVHVTDGASESIPRVPARDDKGIRMLIDVRLEPMSEKERADFASATGSRLAVYQVDEQGNVADPRPSK